MIPYQFTFARIPRGQRMPILQRVLVHATDHGTAWSLMEALYPPKQYLVFSVRTLNGGPLVSQPLSSAVAPRSL